MQTIMSRWICRLMPLLLQTAIGCQSHERHFKYWGTFAIEQAIVDGQQAEVSSDRTQTVLDIRGSKLVVSPMWTLEGMDVLLKLEPSERNNFALENFEVTSTHLANARPLRSGKRPSSSTPYYFLSDPLKGARKELKLPLTIQAETTIGLSTGLRPDKPPAPHTFSLSLLYGGHHYNVEIVARRKI